MDVSQAGFFSTLPSFYDPLHSRDEARERAQKRPRNMSTPTQNGSESKDI